MFNMMKNTKILYQIASFKTTITKKKIQVQTPPASRKRDGRRYPAGSDWRSRIIFDFKNLPPPHFEKRSAAYAAYTFLFLICVSFFVFKITGIDLNYYQSICFTVIVKRDKPMLNSSVRYFPQIFTD